MCGLQVRTERTRVYNLNVLKLHNYAVGSDGVVVHNGLTCPLKPSPELVEGFHRPIPLAYTSACSDPAIDSTLHRCAQTCVAFLTRSIHSNSIGALCGVRCHFAGLYRADHPVLGVGQVQPSVSAVGQIDRILGLCPATRSIHTRPEATPLQAAERAAPAWTGLKLKVDPSSIWAWETGEHRPNPKPMLLIKQLLGE